MVFVSVIVLVLLSIVPIYAETDNLVLARIGTRDGVAVYHYGEVIQTRGKWIFPDILYIDYGKNNYREMSVGGGIFLAPKKTFSVVLETSIVRAMGSASQGATYLSPYFQFNYTLAPKVIGETVYFPVFPITKSARIQHVLDRTKIEYDFKRFRVGGGYAAYKWADEKWCHKPFVTATLKTGRFGEFEFWLQRMPEGSPQFHIRHGISFKTNKG